MNIKKITAFAAAAVMAAGICTGVPMGTDGAPIAAVTAEAADGDFVIETDENGDKFISAYTGKGGDVTIPDGVKYIAEMAFAGNDNIVSVTFPKSCTIIDKYAFAVAEKLKKVTFNGDAVINMQGFAGCDELESVIINGNASIGELAFSPSLKLESVTIKGSIKPTEKSCGIEKEAFLQCEALKKVKISKSNYEFEIADGAFQNCISLETINIPSKCTEIKNGAFFNCYSLKKITIPPKTKLNFKKGYEPIGLCALDDGNKIDFYIADGKTSGHMTFGDYSLVTPMLTVTVTKGSSAEKYCKEAGLKYVYAKSGGASDTSSETGASVPANFKASTTANSVTLSWDAVDGAAMYRVYKYNPETKKYEKYKDVKSAKCTVSGLTANTKYKFKVVSYSKSGGKYVKGESSKAVSVTTKK